MVRCKALYLLLIHNIVYLISRAITCTSSTEGAEIKKFLQCPKNISGISIRDISTPILGPLLQFALPVPSSYFFYLARQSSSWLQRN